MRYVPGTSYTILTAPSGVGGVYNNVNSMLPGYVSVTPIYDPTDIRLLIATNFRGAAGTFNQASVANYLDSLPVTPGSDLAKVFSGLNTLNPGQLRNALDQIGGEQYQSLLTVARLRSLFQQQVLTDQIRSGIGGNFWAGDGTARGQCADGAAPMSAFSDHQAWGRFYGLGGSVTGDGNAEGFNYNFYGFQTGYDCALNEFTRVGVVGGYTHTNVNFQYNGGGAGDGFLTGVYGSIANGNGYLIGSTTYEFNQIKVTRPLVFDGISRQAAGLPDQDAANTYIEGGYNCGWEGWLIRPLLGLQYTYINQTAFSEVGANSLNLSMQNQDTSALWLMPGVRIGKPLYHDNWTLVPAFHASWVHDMIGEDRLIAGSLTGAGGTFAVQGASSGRDYLVTGISMAAQSGSWRHRLVLDYP